MPSLKKPQKYKLGKAKPVERVSAWEKQVKVHPTPNESQVYSSSTHIGLSGSPTGPADKIWVAPENQSQPQPTPLLLSTNLSLNGGSALDNLMV